MKQIMKRAGSLFALAGLCICLLTGCGDGITDETADAVTRKTNQALEMYSNIEKLVKDNNLKVEKEFTDMKEQLTTMSTQVKSGLADTTEEDGQQALQGLDKIIANLESVKGNLEKSIANVK